MKRACFTLLLLNMLVTTGHGQVNGKLRVFLSDSNWLVKLQVRNITEVRKFYAAFNYEPQWTTTNHADHRVFLFVLLRNTAKWGLYSNGYYPDLKSERVNDSMSVDELMEEDIKLSNAAIQFYTDLKYGNTIPPIGYNEPGFTPATTDIVPALVQAMNGHSLDQLAEELQPLQPETRPLLNRIRWLQYILCDSGVTEPVIYSTAVAATNTALVTRLYQLGFINAADPVSDSVLFKGLALAGAAFQVAVKPGMETDRKMIGQLNVPLRKRLEQLFVSLNYYRWLSVYQNNQQVAVVNIPAATLKLYFKNEVVLAMRMIVGKPTTPTPTLFSRISEVVLYPYWMVPAPIAKKELLPQIKKNPGFIQAGGFQVLDKAGRIIDPDSVNWHLYSKANFPFILRQSTGCDNALGILKLNFYSPYGVYLHDTNDRNLFSRSRRFFSHGCMRMEKPFDMARLVLKSNHLAIDTLEGQCLNNHKPVYIPAEEKIAVLVWYNPAGIDADGRVQFYEDIYNRWPAKAAAMDIKQLVD